MDTKLNMPSSWNEEQVLHDLTHYLPAQAPLKDFIHHNTLHAFQHQNFFDGVLAAKNIFGYKTLLTPKEYQKLYKEGKIGDEKIIQAICKYFPNEKVESKFSQIVSGDFEVDLTPRVGKIRAVWKEFYHFDIGALVHHVIFRIICNYLDQGISIWPFPSEEKGLLNATRDLDKHSVVSLFRTKKGRHIFHDRSLSIRDLLQILIGKREELYNAYLVDMSFEHPGWSGMIATIEKNKGSLLDTKEISLSDFIHLELCFEIDAAYNQFGNSWRPLGDFVSVEFENYFEPQSECEIDLIQRVWQEAMEWTYYDSVLAGLQKREKEENVIVKKTFQAVFCIDDREGSMRRYVEQLDENCETFGMPGFFGVEFYFQPQGGKFYEKVCPAPITPKHLIREEEATRLSDEEVQFNKNSHHNLMGWALSIVYGFWSAIKLMLNIFRPGISPATSLSFRHMEKDSVLTVEHVNEHIGNLQVGFTVEEMANRVETSLRTIGLVNNFAPLVYFIGHGASSVNNPHYAAYDCGACSGRAGSANARTFAIMANNEKVRTTLRERGIDIPEETQFIGGLRDTTRDQTVFYDGDILSSENSAIHQKNKWTFRLASDLNAKERSRRFDTVNTKASALEIHQKILRRSVSIFEPRPELNHATNALCIVGTRQLTKHLFLDRRSFLNSYDPAIDPEGKYLYGILKAAAPVCGGINLEYYFSRTDNHKLGAGTKLPHNVMGLIGVANGVDGDLRPGLPSQMIEVHDPVRLLIVVEQQPQIVLKTIQTDESTYEWFKNEWVHLVSIHPETAELFVFENEKFIPFKPSTQSIPEASSIEALIENHTENISVHILN
ncbi:MAG: YbcC family protein [Bacteroidota bacterium]